MANYIGWYLVEIERRFKGILPSRRIIELQREVEDHMLSSMEDAIAQKLDPTVAERLAVENFGSPASFVKKTIQSLCVGHVSPTLKMAQSALIVFMIVALGIAAVFYRGLPFSFLLLGLIPLAVISFLTKTTPWKVMLGSWAILTPIAMIASGLLIIQGWGYGSYFTKGQADTYIALRTKNLKQIEASAALLHQGMEIYRAGDHKTDSPASLADARTIFGIQELPESVQRADTANIPTWLMKDGWYLVPSSTYSMNPTDLMWRDPSIRVPIFFDYPFEKTVKTFEEAKVMWKGRAPNWDSMLSSTAMSAKLELTRVKSLSSGYNFDGSVATSIGGAGMLVVLVCVGGCVVIPSALARMFALVRLRRRALA